VALFVPPVFDDIRRRLAREIREFIAGLPLNEDQKAALLDYYDKVWSLYLQTLKNSKLWEVYCGAAAYAKIKEYSGFDIARWMHKNILWGKDLDEDTRDFLKRRDLLKYLKW
jgi:hypothetical protein